jgi:hypothetical protein
MPRWGARGEVGRFSIQPAIAAGERPPVRAWSGLVWTDQIRRIQIVLAIAHRNRDVHAGASIHGRRNK